MHQYAQQDISMKKYVLSMVDVAVCWKMEKLYQTYPH